MAAIQAAERGRSTIILEKNHRAGVKLLISGGGRCNLTHACDERGVATAFGPEGRFLHSPLAAFGPAKLMDWFWERGVSTYAEPGGKVFPTSERAADVLDALLRQFRRSGAQMALAEAVVDIRPISQGFLVKTIRRTLHAHAVLVATGGMSYPGCGTTGDAYPWLAALGHTIHPPHPALVPLTTSAAWVQRLTGIARPDVLVHAIPSDPSAVKRGRSPRAIPRTQQRGALLFTHSGLSGPAPMDVSRVFTQTAEPATQRLLIDFLPDLSADALDASLQQNAAAAGRKQIATILPRSLPKSLREALVEQAGSPADRYAAELTRSERNSLVEWLKRAVIPISGSCGFAQAEVTAGGVALDEVDARTMQSKIVPGLYLTGEILDLDGPIGGYNLQAAFSTGWQAGSHI